jgi:hypothetical protein
MEQRGVVVLVADHVLDRAVPKLVGGPPTC